MPVRTCLGTVATTTELIPAFFWPTMHHMARSTIDSAADLQRALNAALARWASVEGGQVADYIPELANANAASFALAACTVEGDLASAGLVDHPFTIQSACKPFIYARALAQLGRDRVHEHVGVEPSGDRFDSIVRVELGGHKPHNPMVNAGALAVTALLQSEAGPLEPARVLAPFTDRQALDIDETVYDSENATADRNRAIAYLMAHLGMLAADPEETLRCYLRCCSVRVTCRDLAVMAATLAAGGRNPLTRDRVLPPRVTQDVLAIMSTCGMYDGTGRFEVDVGMPAKSGVAGGVLAVAPGRLGLGVFSPPLDERGNSVRGMAVLQDLAGARALHMFDAVNVRGTAARRPLRDPGPALQEVYDRQRHLWGGAVAEYLVPVTDVGTHEFAIAVCTVTGQEMSLGDADRPFTIQAAANPLTYAAALSEYGPDAVRRRVGVEPSGEPYHAIRFHPDRRRPHNPLGNAGAIAMVGLFADDPQGDGSARLTQMMGRLGARSDLGIDAAVLTVERANRRNRAIAHLLRNCGVIGDVEAAFTLYAEQCARLVTCVDLARIGATLAAHGRHPSAGGAVVPEAVMKTVLAVMYTCGMHDASGRFAFEVGLPGKSGVSGGLLVVVPGRMGLAAYSPLVDAHGMSVRGFAAMREISRTLDLGVFAFPADR